MSNTENTRRIAKNTALLYGRTLFTILISLYTSRVILNQLGVTDYGIYSVVGGVVSMFSVVSSAMSSSISRYITFELGKKNSENLQKIFSTSVNIQLLFAFAILLLGETVGLWFVNHKLEISPDKMYAANWVYQFSLAAFCIGVVSVPYTASVIAREKMSIFAYISITEALLKLGICYLLIISPFNKLIFYSILMMGVSIVIRMIYGIYCGQNFKECHYKFTFDKTLLKEMGGFAGWSFLLNTSWIFNTQGINILINLYFGVVLNAARQIATQVEGSVSQFVNSFTVAINPQITKSYAAGDLQEMYSLVCRGAKFSFLLLLIPALPVMFEADYILTLWLKTVPAYTPIFVRLTLVSLLVTVIGNSSYTACNATGKIKEYSIYITLVGCLVFPLTWVAYRLKLPPQSSYYAYIAVYFSIDIIRLIFMRRLTAFPLKMFLTHVINPIAITTFAATAIIWGVEQILTIEQTAWRFIILLTTAILTTIGSIFIFGLTGNERTFILNKIHSFIKR